MRVVVAAFLLGVAAASHGFSQLIRIETNLGSIDVQLEPVKAPVTVRNFLRYVDDGRYEQGRFHRTVLMDNQPDNVIRIEVIQGGPRPGPPAIRPSNWNAPAPQACVISMASSLWPVRIRIRPHRTSSFVSAINRNSISAASAIPTARASPLLDASRAVWMWSARYKNRRTRNRSSILRSRSCACGVCPD